VSPVLKKPLTVPLPSDSVANYYFYSHLQGIMLISVRPRQSQEYLLMISFPIN